MNPGTPEPALVAPSRAVTRIEVRKILVKAVCLLVVGVLGGAAYRFTALKDWLEPAGALADWVRQAGWVGVLAFIGSAAILVFLGVPRLIFCPIAGALFGVWLGLLVSVVSSLAGYHAAFLLVRGRKRDDLNVRWPRGLAFLAHDPGFGGVIVARLLPLPGLVVNLGLALSRVRKRVYLAGTAIGMIPQALPLVLLGAGLIQHSATDFIRLGVLGLLALGGSALAVRYFVKRHQHLAATPPSSAP